MDHVPLDVVNHGEVAKATPNLITAIMTTHREADVMPTLEPFGAKGTSYSYLCAENVDKLRARGCPTVTAAVLLCSITNLKSARDFMHISHCGHLLDGMEVVHLP